ncbi:FUSC family protein [Beijerinckia mobilis]|uniref:FUSC family protein n=1 Tax=Beijerinckia mobilis TaxID=231434 RepID=UPI00068ACBB3|nr:FUSC family protein [Beijerinckia mobilis]
MARPRLADLLAPFPGRLAFAVRIGLICALTVLIAETYETLEPALSAYIVFFLNKEDRVSSLIMHIAGLVLISLIIGLVFLLAILVIDYPVWRVLTMMLVSFIVLFLGSASKLSAIAPILALVVAYALDLLGMIPQGELATRALLHAWLMIGLPVFAGIVVNVLIGVPPRLLAERALAKRLYIAAAALRGAGADGDESIGKLRALLREGNAALLKNLALAGFEHTSPALDLAALKSAAAASFRLLALIDGFFDLPEPFAALEERERLAATAEAMVAIFAQGLYPVEIEASLPPDASPLLVEIDRTLQIFTLVAPDREDGTAEAPARPEKPKEKSGFFKPDAFTNPDHIRHALKTTAAAMICYIVYLQLDWSGIHTCLITCYIVSLGSAAETAQKMMLRFTGAAIGAAAGTLILVFIIPQLQSIGALMLLVFLGTLPAAWVAAGGERIAYAGFQIAFAFFLCVLQDYGPGFDLTVARDRVIGIFFGNLVMYVMATQIWPVSIAGRAGATITAGLRGLRDMARSANAPQWNAGALAACGAIARLEGALELMAFEPVSLRPSIAWRQARARVSADLAGVFRLLAILTPASDPVPPLNVAARCLDGLARAGDEGDFVAAETTAAAAAHERESMQAGRVPASTFSIRAELDRRIDALTLAVEEAARTDSFGQPVPRPSARAFHAAS